MRRFLLGALLALSCVCPALAGDLTLYGPDTSLPSRSFCMMAKGEYFGASGTLSTSGDPFFNSSTNVGGSTATIEEMPPYTDITGGTTSGAVRERLGTNATNDSGVRSSTTLTSLGRGSIVFKFRGREVAVSDGTNTFIQRVGLFDSDTAPVDEVAFEYTHSVNSGKWQFVVRKGNVEQSRVDTGVTFAAGTNRTMEIDINAVGSSVTAMIDGTTTNIVSSNLPGATDYLGFGWDAVRSAGTADNINPMALTYIGYLVMLTTPRC